MFSLLTDSDQGIAIPSGYNKTLLEHFLTFKIFGGFFFFSFFLELQDFGRGFVRSTTKYIGSHSIARLVFKTDWFGCVQLLCDYLNLQMNMMNEGALIKFLYPAYVAVSPILYSSGFQAKVRY